jgi:hypothetical protein
MQLREQGWECPKCQRIWAPKINACGACNSRQTLDHVPIRPYIGSPPTTNGTFTPRFTCEQTDWNFTAEDGSFAGE